MDAQILQASTSPENYDAVVVGAGPYGLTSAAHLLGKGLKVAVFGKPLQFWREHMPRGMLLRSYWWATSFSDPYAQFGIEQYLHETGQEPIDPLAVGTVLDYGLWFQKHVIPNIDETYVKTITSRGKRFEVTLEDGRMVYCLFVIMAPGLKYYTHRPPEYSHLPLEIVSHTSDHVTFDRFADKTVMIIGGGQSALETAALAYKAGAHVQIISRSPLTWIQGSPIFPQHRSLIERLRSPKAGIAPGWFNWGLERFPYCFQRLPRTAKERILCGVGSYGPMGAAWLKPQVVGKVPVYERQYVQQIREVDDGIMLILSNNLALKANHVILGTGYRVNIKNLPMLDPSLLKAIETYHNAPILNNQFESSIAGLYFVGFSSVSSCGPLYRFVVGTEAAARRVAHSIVRQVL